MTRRATSRVLALCLGLSTPALAEERQIATDVDVAIHLIDTGPDSDRTIVFIPGWGMSSAVWHKQVDHFSKRWRVIALDPRSQGRSTITNRDVSPEARARDLAAILDKLAIEKAVLVAWSQGVQDVAAYAAAQRDARIAGIVLVDALPARGFDSAAADPAVGLNLRLANLYLSAPADYAKGMVDAIFAKPLTDAERSRFEADVVTTPPAVGSAMMIASLYGRDRRDALAPLCIPSLVIAPANSASVESQRSYAASLKAGRFRSVDDAGHAVFHDQPDAFNAIVEAFLAETAAPPACAR